MDYIILDMEWNQPWPGSPSAKKPLPVQIRGEIIQIGAVRILEDQTVADEFQVLIKPRFYRRLNKRVSKLTGIQEARLKAEGIPFPEAMEQFRAWCGEDVAFLTWGFDDIAILQENLALFQLPADWTRRWYNAQMMFNAQTADGQWHGNGGDCWLRILEFLPDGRTVSVRTFAPMFALSPVTCDKAWRTADYDQFTFDME